MRLLASSHGIGLIVLDPTSAENLQLLIPAREKENLDWEAINRLMINNDFKAFITDVRASYQTGVQFK
jgi:hypothetical protein